MGSGIRFVFRGALVELEDVRPTMSVLEWLRQRDGSRGTKEGCNQGDCGACTIAIATLEPEGLRLSTANACLMLMPMLDGKALLTVEDVGTPAAMHPVQEALAAGGGSQCGFCTPGFVMSLWAHCESSALCSREPSRSSLTEAITGNLCRCTGYRPIVDSAVAACERAPGNAPMHDWAATEAALREVGAPRLGSDTGFLAPATEAELARVLAEHPDARIVAGGTDLVVALRASGEILDDDLALIAVAAVSSLRDVVETPESLVIGAGVRLDDAWTQLVLRAPGLARMQARFASPAIRAMGTIGGNIANASPIADLVPVLIGLDAQLELVSVRGSRLLDLESFATGVRATNLQPGEFLARVLVPITAFDRDIRAYKVSRRYDDDISAVSAVMALRLDGGVIADVRVVLGGMAETVRRAAAVEARLAGKEWNEVALRAAQEAMTDDFSPIDDHRASGWYRMQAAKGLLARWWMETGVDAPDIPADVWAKR